MPVLRSIRERFAAERPLDGARVAACLHVTAETASLVARSSRAAPRPRCARPTRFTQDEVAAALAEQGVEVHARTARTPRCTPRTSPRWRTAPADHARRRRRPADALHALGARAGLRRDEETTHGAAAPAAARADGRLACPVIAVNEARTERAFNDRHGTGQSALDGILRATNLLLAGRTLVVSATAGPARASPSAPAAPGRP